MRDDADEKQCRLCGCCCCACHCFMWCGSRIAAGFHSGTWTTKRASYLAFTALLLGLILMTDAIFLVQVEAFVAPLNLTSNHTRLLNLNALVTSPNVILQQTQLVYCDAVVPIGGDFFSCALLASPCVNNATIMFLSGNATRQNITVFNITQPPEPVLAAFSNGFCTFSTNSFSFMSDMSQLYTLINVCVALVITQGCVLFIVLFFRVFVTSYTNWSRILAYYLIQAPMLYMKYRCLTMLVNARCWIDLLGLASCASNTLGIGIDVTIASLVGWFLANFAVNLIQFVLWMVEVFYSHDEPKRSSGCIAGWLPLILVVMFSPLLAAAVLNDTTLIYISASLMTFAKIAVITLFVFLIVFTFMLYCCFGVNSIVKRKKRAGSNDDEEEDHEDVVSSLCSCGARSNTPNQQMRVLKNNHTVDTFIANFDS